MVPRRLFLCFLLDSNNSPPLRGEFIVNTIFYSSSKRSSSLACLHSRLASSRLASPRTAAALGWPPLGPQFLSLSHATHHPPCHAGGRQHDLLAQRDQGVVPRKRHRMLFFGYKLRGTAAWPKLVVPSIVKAQSCRPG